MSSPVKPPSNVELRELRHAGKRRQASVGQEPAPAEKPSDRHVAQLAALGHLLHGGLHLLL